MRHPLVVNPSQALADGLQDLDRGTLRLARRRDVESASLGGVVDRHYFLPVDCGGCTRCQLAVAGEQRGE